MPKLLEKIVVASTKDNRGQTVRHSVDKTFFCCPDLQQILNVPRIHTKNRVYLTANCLNRQKRMRKHIFIHKDHLVSIFKRSNRPAKVSWIAGIANITLDTVITKPPVRHPKTSVPNQAKPEIKLNPTTILEGQELLENFWTKAPQPLLEFIEKVIDMPGYCETLKQEDMKLYMTEEMKQIKARIAQEIEEDSKLYQMEVKNKN